VAKREVKKKREKVSGGEGERNKVKEIKKKTPFWKRFLIMLGLFILALVFYSLAATLFFLQEWTGGLVLSLLGLAVNIFIFIKGRKGAAILGVFLLLGGIFSMAGLSFVGFLFGGDDLKELSIAEQNQILASHGESIENLFYGYQHKNYTIFSRDLNYIMVGRYDKIAFANLYDELGSIIFRNCSTAARTSTGDRDIIFCDVEFLTKKTLWDIRFSENGSIYGLYTEDVHPNIIITFKLNKTADSINVKYKGSKTVLNADENRVYIIFSVSVKNNEDKAIKIHNSQFLNEKYSYDSVEEEYTPTDCVLFRDVSLQAGEVKEGCFIFLVYEDYQNGTISVI